MAIRQLIWSNKKDFDTLLDIDGCIFFTQKQATPQQIFLLQRTYDLLKPGSYCICIAPNTIITTEWAMLLEDTGFEIKDQIAALYFEQATTIIVGMKACKKNYAENALQYGVAGINISKLRIGNDIVGWNGLGKTGQTWTKDSCGFRKEQAARPVQGRFPCNLILEAAVATKVPQKKCFHVIDNVSESAIINFCLDLITPPGEESILIQLFAENNLFKTICQQRQQSCIIAYNNEEEL